MTLLFNNYQKINIYNNNNDYAIKNTKTRMHPALLSSLALVVFFINGCSDGSQYDQVSDGVAYEESTQAAEDMGAAPASMMGIAGQADLLTVENIAGDSEQTLGSQVTDIEIAGKKLLIRAHANFKVADVVKSGSAIETLTRQQGGYVALSNISNNETDRRTFTKGAQDITLTTYYRQATMTVRIPKAKVTDFLKRVQQQVAFLNEQEFSAQDVTLDIYREQLAATLNSNMAVELTQERLNSKNGKDQNSNVDAITATYAARRQQQYAKLEQMDIEDKIKYSTIDLTFMQPASSYKEVSQNLDILIDAERPSFGTQVNEAFKQGWDTLKTVTLTLIGLWWLLIIVGLFYLLYKFIKKSYQQLVKHKVGQKKSTPARQLKDSSEDTGDNNR